MTQLATFTGQPTGGEGVSYEEFLRLTDGMHAEWVDGEVIPGVAISRTHDNAHNFLHHVLDGFAGERGLGEVHRDPFQMKTGPGLPGRAPDLIFVATEHLNRLHENYLEGPADLAVEIVSPGNASTDYVDKYREYETGGVAEYWILDPLQCRAEFLRLSDGRYELAPLEANRIFRSHALEGFFLDVEWLFRDSLPKAQEKLQEILAAG